MIRTVQIDPRTYPLRAVGLHKDLDAHHLVIFDATPSESRQEPLVGIHLHLDDGQVVNFEMALEWLLTAAQLFRHKYLEEMLPRQGDALSRSDIYVSSETRKEQREALGVMAKIYR